ncbi:MAG: FtsX-like permease family protein [Candidatus Nanopelagicales bacterium]
MTSQPLARSGRSPAARRGGHARRAVARWGWRMFRREWRQQALVLTLLAAAVAASVGVASAAYSLSPVPNNAEFGAASHYIRLSNTDPDALASAVTAASERFDNSEVIYHRDVAIPGLFEPADYRSQDPSLALGQPRLALVDGAYPRRDEVAITDGLAEMLGVRIGDPLDLDGVERTVVGIVENPANLGDEFGLLAPAQSTNATKATILVDASEEQVNGFRPPAGSDVGIGSRPPSEGATAALLSLVLSTVGLLLVALIAAASFAVIAQRRMRHLAMLAAIGATERQIRAATVANGLAVGGVAALIGAAVGVAAWLGLAPLVEEAVAYRIDEYAVPWWLVVSPMVLAIAAATSAAWWPARSVARVPTMRALSGRPPQPRPARRVAVWSAASAVVGVGLLFWGGDLAGQDDADWAHAALIVAGTVAVALAMLLACPPAIRVLAASVGRLPVAVRLAVGDLARYRSRSSAALAAVSLALCISAAITVMAAAAQAGAAEGNLSEHQVVVRYPAVDGPFVPVDAELERLAADVENVVASFDDAEVIPLDVAIDPRSGPDPSFEGRVAASLVERDGDGWRDVSLLYVATPRLLEMYGLEVGDISSDTFVVTREVGDFAVLGHAHEGRSNVAPLTNVERLSPGYESLPGTFVTPAVLEARGWVAVPSGRWLVELQSPPTATQLEAARRTAAQTGLSVEVRDPQGGLGNLRLGATAIGSFIALGIIAMMVGLLRSEAARDLRILAATGAQSRTRRTITASTAGGIALLGALLGIGGAYLGLVAGFAHNLDALIPVPVENLAMIVVGFPVLAAGVGWLVSGRTVNDIARQPIE